MVDKAVSTIDRLVKEFTRFPGVGPAMARRMVFSLINRPVEEAERLARTIDEVVHAVRHCRVCGNFSVAETCDICANDARDATLICVVEQPQDVQVIERTGQYQGVYHVLMGVLSPMDGTTPADLRIRELLERLRGDVREVILATNPNVKGDTTAFYLTERIKPLGIRVTRIARGLPTGGDLEYADEATLGQALGNRVEL